MLLGSPSTVVTRQFIRLPVTISILITTCSAGGISAEKSGLELGPCFNTDAWRGFKEWQLQRRLACVWSSSETCWSCVRRELRDFYDGVRRRRQVCSVNLRKKVVR